MIGSNSWGGGASLSGRIARAVVPAALAFAAFLIGEPHRTGRETDTLVSTVRLPLRRAARLLVFLDTQYGWRKA
jgi:hypothetical protein